MSKACWVAVATVERPLVDMVTLPVVGVVEGEEGGEEEEGQTFNTKIVTNHELATTTASKVQSGSGRALLGLGLLPLLPLRMQKCASICIHV